MPTSGARGLMSSPTAQRRAVIDVGTNSVKLLVADVSGAGVTPLLEQSEQTRLGAGFFETHYLRPQAIEETARVVERFAATALQYQPDCLRVIATSAARDARNQAELLRTIRERSGLSVEVLSGEQEADWAFLGVAGQPEFAGGPLLILDVGGGSTEFILGQGARRQFQGSYALGTVRLLEQLDLADPPTPGDWARCRQRLSRFFATDLKSGLSFALSTITQRPTQLVGTGGTTTILARMALQMPGFDRNRIETLRLSRSQVQAQRKRLWQLPLVERRQVLGLPPDRADVILTGVAIVETVMHEFEFSEMRTSTRGLRFGAILATGNP